jgi:hypothetical protein
MITQFLKCDWTISDDFDENDLTEIREQMIKKIVNLTKKVKPSCEVTRENILLLEEYINLWSDTDLFSEKGKKVETFLNDFTRNAFKDLTVLKNPYAMRVFQDLATEVIPGWNPDEHPDQLFVWARKVNERDDGSGVYVIHASNAGIFERLLNFHQLVSDNTDNPELFDCLVFNSESI